VSVTVVVGRTGGSATWRNTSAQGELLGIGMRKPAELLSWNLPADAFDDQWRRADR